MIKPTLNSLVTPLAIVCLVTIAAASTLTRPTVSERAENKIAPDLAFLAGHWRSETGGGVIEETWFPPANNSTTGMLRWFAPDGSLRMLELITIKPGDDGTPVLLLRHFDPGMQPWEAEKSGPFTAPLESHAPGSLAFRPTANARDAVRMSYESTGPETMRVTIEFRETSGRQPVVIELARVE